MNKQKLYIIIGGVVVILIAIIIGIIVGKSKTTGGTPSPIETTNPRGTGAPGTVNSTTRAEVPSNLVVPNQNSTATSVPKDVAIPKVSIPAAPGVSASLRVFDISANGGTFTPSTIVAYTGDTIHINFTAVDKAYDITFPDYGMKQTAQKGEQKVLEFQAQTTGKFTYYCDMCGGLNSTTLGYIIVVPKQ